MKQLTTKEKAHEEARAKMLKALSSLLDEVNAEIEQSGQTKARQKVLIYQSDYINGTYQSMLRYNDYITRKKSF